MSTDSDHVEPTDPNPYVAAEVVGDTLPVFARCPSPLTAICVLSIVLGVLAIGSSFNIILSIIVTSLGGMNGLLGPGFGGTGEVARIQADMQDQITEVQRQFTVLQVIQVVLLMGLAIALLIGALRTMGLKEAGRRILLWTCALAIPFELIRGVYLYFLQTRMMAITNLHTERLTKAMANDAAVMSGFIQAMTYAGLVFAAGWLLLKVGFYCFGVHYLRKQDVLALFDEAPTK